MTKNPVLPVTAWWSFYGSICVHYDESVCAMDKDGEMTLTLGEFLTWIRR